MNRKLKLLMYCEWLIIIQLLTFIFPLLITTRRVLVMMMIPLNAVLSLIIIKKIEMMYYKKYNKWSSMLYMICPLIGMVLLYIVSLFVKLEGLKVINIYYVILFAIVYIFNIIYILIRKNKA